MDYSSPAGRDQNAARKWWWPKALVPLAVMAVYLVLPLLAGVFAIGDRRGPRVYPASFHEPLYVIGWEVAGRDGKPRVLGRGASPRPWFYGL